MLVAATLHPPDLLHTAIIVGPDSTFMDRIVGGMRHHGLTVLRTQRIDPESCDALAGASGYALVIVTQSADKALDSCSVADTDLPAPLLRIVTGRLVSVTLPSSAIAALADVLARAGVRVSAAMASALSPPA